jgi:hypothetical protein
MQVLSDALASAAITQQQALTAQKAADDADKAQALAAQQASFAQTLSDAVAAAVAAGNLSQQQAVAAQAAADAAVQSTALAAQATAYSASEAQSVAYAVQSQQFMDSAAQADALAQQAIANRTAQNAAVAAAVAAQSASDASALATALAAQIAADRLKWLPSFYNTNNLSMPVAVGGQTFTVDKTVSAMDYNHVWVVALQGLDVTTYTGVSGASGSTLAAGQVSPTRMVLYNTSSYNGMSEIQAFLPRAGAQIYSGWLRPGTAAQRVGWVVNVGTTSTPSWSLYVTPYGYTSASPTARYPTTLAQTYALTTADAQAEVVGKMAVSTNTVFYLGFIFDASVGNFGQVTWISQI